MSNGRDILDFLEDAVDAMEKAEKFISEMSYEEMKNPAAETAGYLNVRNCLFIFAR